ncbi:unnamed protein product [Amaranthus hypochondriacus]
MGNMMGANSADDAGCQRLLCDDATLNIEEGGEKNEAIVEVYTRQNHDGEIGKLVPSAVINTQVGPALDVICPSLGHVPTLENSPSQAAALGSVPAAIVNYSHEDVSVSGPFTFNAGSDVGSTRKVVKVKRKGGPRSTTKILSQ